MDLPDLGFRPTLGEAARRAAREFGDLDYLVTPTRRMTFAEADAASRRLARRMLAEGLGKGTRVGLYFTYGHEWLVAWLAASRIGALVMPFSTLYTPAELGKVLRIGDVDTLITAPSILGRDTAPVLEEAAPGLADQRAGRLYLTSLPYLRRVWMSGPTDRAWATTVDLEAEPGRDAPGEDVLEQVETEVVPADLALVVYTSGSSAEPKGVVHTQGTVLRDCSEMAARFFATETGAPGRLLCGMPFFWVGGVLALSAGIQAPITVVVMERFEPGLALELVERERVTGVLAWPTLIQAMRDHPTFAERDLSSCPSLTEGPADMALTWSPVPGVGGHRGMSETMGQFVGFERRIIDHDTGEPLPRGIEHEGELVLRGPGLMAGYYKRERHEVFDEDGWFHTGDRCFMIEGDERPFFLGRYTEMIKSMGANVAPREVELLLETFPEIRYAFVLGFPHPERGEEVVAAVVPADGAVLDHDDLRARARKQLSSFKVPTRFVELDADEVPWLGSGKPDKLTLRKMVETRTG